MPKLALGNSGAINKWYIGNTEVGKIYQGNVLRHEAVDNPADARPQQTFDLGTASYLDNRNVEWTLEPNLLINNDLTVGKGNCYLAELTLAWGGWVSLRISDAATGSDSTDNKELKGKWETNAVDAVVIATSARTLTLPGPNAQGVNVKDSTEPYRWRRTGDGRVQIRQFISWYNSDSAAIRATAKLTLIATG